MSEKKRFLLEEIGDEWLTGYIVMKKDFVNKHLGKLFSKAPYFKWNWERKIETDIYCPYCKEGVLTLIKKEKDICETHVCHTGNSYILLCSKRCNEVGFFYTNTWLYC